MFATVRIILQHWSKRYAQNVDCGRSTLWLTLDRALEFFRNYFSKMEIA